MNKEQTIRFLEHLGIDTTGTFEPERYILEIESSDDFSRYYTLFDDNEDWDCTLSDTGSITNQYSTILSYVGDGYKVSLNANYVDDYYSLVLEEIE